MIFNKFVEQKSMNMKVNRVNGRICLGEKILDLPVFLMSFTDEVLLSNTL